MSGEDRRSAPHNFPQPNPDNPDASIIGLTDPVCEVQSASRLTSQTDDDTLPNLKRPCADSYNRLEERRWARQKED